MALLDRIAEQQTLDDNRDVADAQHDLDWKSAFSSTPSAEVLRSRVNMADTINRAFDNKIELQARSDVKALELMDKTARHREWMDQAPLREELLKRKVESQGAHDRFVQSKDSEAMAHAAGFLKAIGSLQAKPGTPEYQAGLNQALQDNPRVLGTQAGMETFRKLQREHQDVAAITPPVGMEVDRIDIGDDGRAKAVFKPIVPKSAVAVPDGMVPSGATVNKRGDVSINYATPKPDKDTTLPSLEKERALHSQALNRAKRIRAKATDPDVMKDADADILESEKALNDVESQIRTHRDGAKPASETKALDKATAEALVKEAAGDKDKARALAKERGYHF